jgi:hypothetical protein
MSLSTLFALRSALAVIDDPRSREIENTGISAMKAALGYNCS